MNEPNILIDIKTDEILSKTDEFQKKGYRIAQICCVKLEEKVMELNYSFEKENEYQNLKVKFSPDTEIPSISRIYLAAFLYENEIHDQFGIKIKDIAVDYKGKFYKIAKPEPFNLPVQPKPAPAQQA